MTTAPATEPRPATPPRAIRFHHLALGLIPVVAGAALVGAMAYQSTRPMKERYRQRAEALAKAGRNEEARACLRRLLTIDPDQPEVRFALAVSHEADRQHASALEIMRALAPADGKGFLPAHYWLAERLAAGAAANPALADEAEAHLLILLRENPKLPLIKRALGMLHARLGRTNRAMPYLLDVAQGDPEVLLTLARCRRDLKDEGGAARYRREAVTAAAARVEKDPKDLGSYVFWSQAVAGLGDFGQAFEILERARTATSAPLIGPIQGALCNEWAETIVANRLIPPETQVSEVCKVVEKGLDRDPANEKLEALANRLALLSGPIGDGFRARLAQMIAPDAPAPTAAAARLVLGNVAMAKGNPTEALAQWRAGYALAPKFLILANNYAWSLAHVGETTDPARALTVIDGVLKDHPNDARLLGTRGLILLKLGRKDDAEADLKRAMAGGNAHPEVKSALAGLTRGDAPAS